MRRIAALAIALVAVAPCAPRARAADAFGGPGGAASLVEKEFAAAIRSVTPAAVYLIGKGGPSPGSSGVIISKDGYILSDGDAGAVFTPPPSKQGPPVKTYSAEVEVRAPDLKRGTYAVFTAKVIRRDASIDSTLLQIVKPPAAGLPFVVPGTSDGLEVGQFTFAMGTAFGQGEGGDATLTAGVVASLVPAPQGQPGGRFSEIETSAAINVGVNGGPLVDVDGSLVGIVSTWGEATPTNPYQFLGKAYPIDRIRHAYADVPDAARIFPDPKTLPAKARNATLLERAILLAARRAAPAVVSLEITRSEPFKMKVPAQGGRIIELARYAGPVSGLSVSRDGFIVSSLYNFANTTPLAYFGFPNEIEATLAKITSITAHYADGTVVPAKLVAHDQRLGIVCLKAERPTGSDAAVVDPAPAQAVRVGRLLVHVADPFGAAPHADPMTTIGMLSRVHPDDDENAWRGCLQTDAGLTDGNCGGALVDVHGRLLAMSTLWNPAEQGRESGIGYGIPWAKIEAALPALEAGTSVVFGGGWMGIGWARDPASGAIRITVVAPDGPAAKAGVVAGDVIVAIDGHPVRKLIDAITAVRTHRPGDKLAVTVDRNGTKSELVIELGTRPGSG